MDFNIKDPNVQAHLAEFEPTTPGLDSPLTPPEPDDRAKAMIIMRSEGKTLEEIGAAQEPPITRERVRQILSRFGVTGRVIASKWPQIRPCEFCGKEMQVYVYQPRKRFCDKVCRHRKLYPNQPMEGDPEYREWSLARKRAMAEERYRTDPSYRAYQKAYQRTEAGRAYHREYNQDRVAKLKADPVKYAAHLAKQKSYYKARYEALKADPVRYEEYLAKQRVYNRAWDARQRAKKKP